MLKHLHHFIVTAQEGNVHRAADRLNITQSALSRRIHQLETYLGVALFERTHKGMSLTDAGKALLEDGERLLKQAMLAERHVKRVADGHTGRLRIGLSDTAAHVPEVLGHLCAVKRTVPELDLMICQKPSALQFHDLVENKLDAAFVYHSPDHDLVFETSDGPFELQSKTLFTDRFALAVPSGHPLATKEEVVIADLEGEVFIEPSRTLGRDLFYMLLRRMPKTAGSRVIVDGTSADSSMSLIAAGLAISYTLFRSCQNINPGVKVRLVKDLHCEINLSLVWSTAADNQALRSMIDMLDGVPTPEQAAWRKRAI